MMASSSFIVPVAVSEMSTAASEELINSIVKFSGFSNSASSNMGTEIVSVSPATPLKTRTPDCVE